MILLKLMNKQESKCLKNLKIKKKVGKMSIIISVSLDEESAKYLAKLRENNINISRYINKLIQNDKKRKQDL